MMFLQQIKSPYLAHLSYILGHEGQAAVIDPRRDCDDYIEVARRHDAVITHIFESHRNEDYLTGSRELARRTGARILHGKALDFKYGEPVEEGDEFCFGKLRLKVLETPGHTFESISLALYDDATSDQAVGVFTGDLLFIGSVGRTDFFPNRAEEVAGLQYDALMNKILPLGDQCLLYPAHGAGSVCGSGMAPREFSSLGYERHSNPMLSLSREDFVQKKASERHMLPPYFKKMEELNLHGNETPLHQIRIPIPMSAEEVAGAAESGAQILDVRSPEAIAGALVPGALAVPVSMLPAYGGFFLDYDRDILLVTEGLDQVEEARTYLLWLGYDRVRGYLAGGMHSWETSGKAYDRIAAMHVDELKAHMSNGSNLHVLDVRKDEEVESGRLRGAQHIFLGDLPSRIGDVPRDKEVVTFCGSGQRAIIAASILKQHGFAHVSDALGSMAACQSRGCPVEK